MNNKKKKIIILIIFVITGIVIGCVLINPKEYVDETDNIKEVNEEIRNNERKIYRYRCTYN